ncbi:MAG: dephospho-CoA kinase [Selenomonas artemidis]|nr:dephospho-CoA kinase [Selenomonas artemidis]
MYVIGLTGGIACGKSTVSEALRREGAAIVDADAIAHELSRPGGAVYDFYVREFGGDILAADGTLDRGAIARRVFADPHVRDRVNARVHPLIRAAATDKIADLRAEGHAAVVLDVPLLFEAGWHRMTDESWVVSVPEDVQLARLMARDTAMSEAEARARIAAQMPLAEKCALADVVIDNGGARTDTERRAAELWRQCLASLS